MKNLFVYAVIAALFFSFPTFGQTVLEGNMKRTVNTYKNMHAEHQQNFFDTLLKQQLSCPGAGTPTVSPCYVGTVTATKCSADTTFCDNPECYAKIMYCHEICDTVFLRLTTDTNGNQYCSDTFSDNQINNLIAYNDCVYRYINCDIVTNGNLVTYRLGNSTAPLPHGAHYETSYSVALLQSIMRSGSVSSLTLYKGVATDFQGKTVYILPFKVEYRYGGGTKYFDVSDTQP